MNIRVIVIFVFFQLFSSEYIEQVNKINNQEFADKSMPELLEVLPLLNETNKIKAFQELINKYAQANSDKSGFLICLLKTALYHKQRVISEFLTLFAEYKFEEDIEELSLSFKQLNDSPDEENDISILDDIVEISYDQEFFEIIKYLVNNNFITIENKLPLHLAVVSDNLDLLKFYINKGLNIDSLDDFKNTPLHMACNIGNYDIVKYLVDNKADINASNEEGAISLHFAIYKNHLYIAKFLIDNGADINKKTILGNMNAFSLACVVNDLNFLKYIFDIGCNINSYYKDDTIILYPIHIACYNRNINMAQFLIENGTNINSKGYADLRALSIACRQLDLNMIKFLIENKAEVNFIDSSGNNLLHEACYMENLDIIKYFINKRPEFIREVNKSGKFPLELLSENFTDIILPEIFDTLEKALINNNISLHYEYFGENIDPILVDNFLLQQGINLYNPEISGYIDNTYSEAKDIESTFHKFNFIQNKIYIIIKLGSAKDIKRLKHLFFFFSKLQITNLLIELINSTNYSQKKIISLIKRVSIDFDLSKLLDIHGKNLLWHIFNKRDLNLAAVFIMLCNSLLSKDSYENSINSFVNIAKLIFKIE